MFKDISAFDMSLAQIQANYSDEFLYAMYCSDFPSNLVKAPYRQDNNASLSFYHSNGKWRWKDLAKNIGGGVFDFIAQMEGTSDLASTLKMLNKRLQDSSIAFNPFAQAKVKKRASNKLIQLVIKDFETVDINAWNTWGISIAYLPKFNMGATTKVFLDKEMIWITSPKNPIYYTYFDDTKHVKGYRPFESNRKKKHIGVIDGQKDIFGYKQIKESTGLFNVIVITKAMKEILFFKSFGIPSVALCGEGYYFPEEVINYLKSRCRYLISFFDRDRAGFHAAWLLRKQYGITPFFITKNHKAKNITDLWETDYKLTYDYIDFIAHWDKTKTVKEQFI